MKVKKGKKKEEKGKEAKWKLPSREARNGWDPKDMAVKMRKKGKSWG